jgi:hypothetical protein
MTVALEQFLNTSYYKDKNLFFQVLLCDKEFNLDYQIAKWIFG